MNYSGNMPDWHQYSSAQQIGTELPPVSQNVIHAQNFGPSINARRLNGPSFNLEALSKSQSEANYNARNYPASPSALNGTNATDTSSMGSMVQIPPCIGPYGTPSPRNTMMESTNSPLESRSGLGGMSNESIGHQSNQLPMSGQVVHLNSATVSTTPIDHRNTPIQGTITPTGRQPLGSYMPCKGPCCNPENNVSHHNWEKYGPYPPPNVQYREANYTVDNRRFNTDYNPRKDAYENREASIGAPTYTVDPRRNFTEYKYRKEPLPMPRSYTGPPSVIQNYPVQNYFPPDYQKYQTYPMKDFSRETPVVAAPQNPAILKYQEQSVIVQQKYFTKQIQYPNGAIPKDIIPTSLSANIISRAQNPYFNPQLARDFPRDYSDSNNLTNRGIQTPNPIQPTYSKYQMYQQKIAMQRFSMENHLRELSRIPGYQSHPKYQECVLRYRELLRLQQTVDYQSTVQDAPRVVSSQMNEDIPPINLQFDQNGVLINSSYASPGYSGLQRPTGSQSLKILPETSNAEAIRQPAHRQPERYQNQEIRIESRSRDQQTPSIQNHLTRGDEVDYSTTRDFRRVQSYSNPPLDSTPIESAKDLSLDHRNSKDFADKPELDVRQFLANWDESEDEEASNATLPEIPSSHSTVPTEHYESVEPVVVPKEFDNCSDTRECCPIEERDVFEASPTKCKPSISASRDILYDADVSSGSDVVICSKETLQAPSSETRTQPEIPAVETTNENPTSETATLAENLTDRLDEKPDERVFQNEIVETNEHTEKNCHPTANESSVVEESSLRTEDTSSSPSSKQRTDEGDDTDTVHVTKNEEDEDRKSTRRRSRESVDTDTEARSSTESYSSSEGSNSATHSGSSESSDDLSDGPETINGTEIHVNARELSEISPPSSKSNSNLTENLNLQKQHSFTSEESHNPDDISLPDLPTSEYTPISTTLNTPIHSDSEDSSVNIIDLTIPANPIEIIQNSPMLSFTHSPIKIEPYEHFDGSDLVASPDPPDFDFDRSNSCDDLENINNSPSPRKFERFGETSDSESIDVLTDTTTAEPKRDADDIPEANNASKDVVNNSLEDVAIIDATSINKRSNQRWEISRRERFEEPNRNDNENHVVERDEDEKTNRDEESSPKCTLEKNTRDDIVVETPPIGTKGEDPGSPHDEIALNLAKCDPSKDETSKSDANSQEERKEENAVEEKSKGESLFRTSTDENREAPNVRRLYPDNQASFTGPSNIPLIPGEDFEEPKIPVLPMEGNCLTKILKNTSPIIDLDILGSDEEKIEKMDDIWMEVRCVEAPTKTESGDQSKNPARPKSSLRHMRKEKVIRKVDNAASFEKGSSDVIENAKPSSETSIVSEEKSKDVESSVDVKQLPSERESTREKRRLHSSSHTENNSSEISKSREKANHINDIATKLLESAKLFEPVNKIEGMKDTRNECDEDDSDNRQRDVENTTESPKVETPIEDRAFTTITCEQSMEKDSSEREQIDVVVTNTVEIPATFDEVVEKSYDNVDDCRILCIDTESRRADDSDQTSLEDITRRSGDETASPGLDESSKIDNTFQKDCDTSIVRDEVRDEGDTEKETVNETMIEDSVQTDRSVPSCRVVATNLPISSEKEEPTESAISEICSPEERLAAELKKNVASVPPTTEENASLLVDDEKPTQEIRVVEPQNVGDNNHLDSSTASPRHVSSDECVPESEKDDESKRTDDSDDLKNPSRSLDVIVDSETIIVDKTPEESSKDFETEEKPLENNSEGFDSRADVPCIGVEIDQVIETRTNSNPCDDDDVPSPDKDDEQRKEARSSDVEDKERIGSLEEGRDTSTSSGEPRSEEDTSVEKPRVIEEESTGNSPNRADVGQESVEAIKDVNREIVGAEETKCDDQSYEMNVSNETKQGIEASFDGIDVNNKSDSGVRNPSEDPFVAYDFNNFDVAPNANDDANLESTGWRYSKARARFEDCERYKNPDNHSESIRPSLENLDNLNTVPVYTTKDGKITYSPNPKYTYRALIMEAREREGYPVTREFYYEKTRNQECDGRARSQEGHRKRKHSEGYDYFSGHPKRSQHEARDHGESSSKYSNESRYRRPGYHGQYRGRSRDDYPRNSSYDNEAKKGQSSHEKPPDKYKPGENYARSNERDKRRNGSVASLSTSGRSVPKQSREVTVSESGRTKSRWEVARGSVVPDVGTRKSLEVDLSAKTRKIEDNVREEKSNEDPREWLAVDRCPDDNKNSQESSGNNPSVLEETLGVDEAMKEETGDVRVSDVMIETSEESKVESTVERHEPLLDKDETMNREKEHRTEDKHEISTNVEETTNDLGKGSDERLDPPEDTATATNEKEETSCHDVFETPKLTTDDQPTQVEGSPSSGQTNAMSADSEHQETLDRTITLTSMDVTGEATDSNRVLIGGNSPFIADIETRKIEEICPIDQELTVATVENEVDLVSPNIITNECEENSRDKSEPIESKETNDPFKDYPSSTDPVDVITEETETKIESVESETKDVVESTMSGENCIETETVYETVSRVHPQVEYVAYSPPNEHLDELKVVPKIVIKKTDHPGHKNSYRAASSSPVTLSPEKDEQSLKMYAHPKIPKILIRNAKSRPSTPSIEEVTELTITDGTVKDETRVPRMKIRLEEKVTRNPNVSAGEENKIPVIKIKLDNLSGECYRKNESGTRPIPKLKIKKFKSAAKRASGSKSPPDSSPKMSISTESESNIAEDDNNTDNERKSVGLESASSDCTRTKDRGDSKKIPKLKIKRQGSSCSVESNGKRRYRSPVENDVKKARRSPTSETSSRKQVNKSPYATVDTDEDKKLDASSEMLDNHWVEMGSQLKSDSTKCSGNNSGSPDKIPKVIIKRVSPTAEFKCELSECERDEIIKTRKWQPEVKLQRSWVLDCMAKQLNLNKLTLKLATPDSILRNCLVRKKSESNVSRKSDGQSDDVSRKSLFRSKSTSDLNSVPRSVDKLCNVDEERANRIDDTDFSTNTGALERSKSDSTNECFKVSENCDTTRERWLEREAMGTGLPSFSRNDDETIDHSRTCEFSEDKPLIVEKSLDENMNSHSEFHSDLVTSVVTKEVGELSKSSLVAESPSEEFRKHFWDTENEFEKGSNVGEIADGNIRSLQERMDTDDALVLDDISVCPDNKNTEMPSSSDDVFETPRYAIRVESFAHCKDTSDILNILTGSGGPDATDSRSALFASDIGDKSECIDDEVTHEGHKSRLGEIFLGSKDVPIPFVDEARCSGSVDSQIALGIFPMSSDIDECEIELESDPFDRHESNICLYHEDAIPTQFELELGITDNMMSDPLEVPMPPSSDVTDCFEEVDGYANSNHFERSDIPNATTEDDRAESSELGINDATTTRLEANSYPYENERSKTSFDSEKNSVGLSGTEGTTRTSSCSDLLVKEVLAAKEMLRKCFSNGGSKHGSKLSARPKTAAEKKQGTSFSFGTSPSNNDAFTGIVSRSSENLIPSLEGRCVETKQTPRGASNGDPKLYGSKSNTDPALRAIKSEKKHSKNEKNVLATLPEPRWIDLKNKVKLSNDKTTISLKHAKRFAKNRLSRDPTRNIPELINSKDNKCRSKSAKHVDVDWKLAGKYKKNPPSSFIPKSSVDSVDRREKTASDADNCKYKSSKLSSTRPAEPKSCTIPRTVIPKNFEDVGSREEPCSPRQAENKMPVLQPEVDIDGSFPVFNFNTDRDIPRTPPIITSLDDETIDQSSSWNLNQDQSRQSCTNSKDIEKPAILDEKTPFCGQGMSVAYVVRDLAYHEKATIKHRRYCTLCERWFPTVARHRRHLTGYQHRHTESTQRRTIHALFTLFTGKPCPRLESASVVRIDCIPGELTPLQIAVQVLCYGMIDLTYVKKHHYCHESDNNNNKTSIPNIFYFELDYNVW